MSGVITAPIGDHPSIFLVTGSCHNLMHTRQHVRTIRDVGTCTLGIFRNELIVIDWSDVMRAECPRVAYRLFINKFKDAYDRSFPFKTLKPVHKCKKPWITKQCLKEIRAKNKLYNVFLNDKSEEAFKIFKAQRNKVNNLLRCERRRYLHRLFDVNIMRKPDLAWKRVNEVLGRKADGNADLSEIISNGQTISGVHLANTFNNYFTSLSSANSHSPHCLQYLGVPLKDSAFLAPTGANEIIHAFMSLKNSNSSDANGFQIRPVKEVLDIIAPILEHVFNLVFLHGHFPEELQKAKVIVLHKGGDANELSNYRPISLLPVFSKGLEKLIYNRMITFIEKHQIITDSQFGFRKGFSTEDALLSQKEIILQSFELEMCTLGVFVDYSKAFDNINHSTLLKKLSHYGFRGVFLELLTSYLKHRQQQVYINHHTSYFKALSAGVPQGSILGPLLFCLYINDIARIDNSARFIIYADDTTLLFTARDAADVIKDANHTLSLLSSWSADNSLKINVVKTKAVLFRPKNRRMEAQTGLYYENSSIEIVPSVKSLGILFEEHMSWNKHTELIAGKISRVCGILNKCKYYLPKDIKLLIYNSLLASHINYCYLIKATTTLANIKNLHIIQKKAIRAIMNAPHNSHTEPFFLQLNLVPLPSLYEKMLSKRYQAAVAKKNNFLRNLSCLKENKKLRMTRLTEKWELPRTRTNYGKQMLCYLLPYHLNNSH